MIVVGLIWFQFYRLKRQMEKQYRDAMNGNNAGNNAGNAGNAGAGFTGYGFANGMRLEDFVRQMQEQADARQAATQPKPKSDTASKTQKQSADQGEYVDFEEIK